MSCCYIQTSLYDGIMVTVTKAVKKCANKYKDVLNVGFIKQTEQSLQMFDWVGNARNIRCVWVLKTSFRNARFMPLCLRIRNFHKAPLLHKSVIWCKGHISWQQILHGGSWNFMNSWITCALHAYIREGVVERD